MKGILEFYENFGTMYLQAVVVDSKLGYCGEVEVKFGLDERGGMEGGGNETARVAA